ncbi:hypothetical protein MRX96_045206 [Rhipicephalus microplus]
MVRQLTSYSRLQTGRCLRRTLIFCAVDIRIYGLVVYCRIHHLPANKEQPYASIVYTAVAGGKAALPCDISSPTPDDSGTLVLWYKDGNIAPIFTLDSRHRRLDHVRRFLPEDLERRFLFDIGHSPAYRQIDSAQEADAGEYRCHVDFRQAHSVNTVIRLKVIGKPRPVVTWWHNKVLVDSDFSFVDGGSVGRNWLDTTELKRSDYLSVLTCQAANNNRTVAMSRSVTLDKNQHNIRDGGDVYLECEVDANPSASEVTWLFDDDEIITNTSAGIIVSSRSLVLQKLHRSRRRRYACVAMNPEGRGTSNIFLLRIIYAPMFKQGKKHRYGASQNDLVSVNCEVEADPMDATFEWRFDSSVSGKRLELS